jgi:hypothetical protein
MNGAQTSGTSGIVRKAALAGFHELLGLGVIEALGDPFLAAKFSDSVLAAQALQHDPNFIFR